MRSVQTGFPSSVLISGLIVLLGFLSACAVDRPAVRSGDLDTQFQVTADPYRNKILQEALAQLGKPYRWGGISPHSGFDCSGLVFFTHRQAGLNVPRMSHLQMSEAKKVALQDIQPGDLVFFRIDSNTNHVGIYIGRNEFVHAPSDGRTVSTESLNSLYWYPRLIAAGNFYHNAREQSSKWLQRGQ